MKKDLRRMFIEKQNENPKQERLVLVNRGESSREAETRKAAAGRGKRHLCRFGGGPGCAGQEGGV